MDGVNHKERKLRIISKAAKETMDGRSRRGSMLTEVIIVAAAEGIGVPTLGDAFVGPILSVQFLGQIDVAVKLFLTTYTHGLGVCVRSEWS